MSHLYPTWNCLDACDNVEASSSIGPNSSPDVLLSHYLDIPDDVPFLALDADAIQDNETSDPSYCPTHRAYSKRVPDEIKVITILQYMKKEFPRLSLHHLLKILFTSDHGSVTNFTNIFRSDGGAIFLMDMLWEKEGMKNEAMQEWVVERGARVCAKELNRLT
jgi:hypothetical protein